MQVALREGRTYSSRLAIRLTTFDRYINCKNQCSVPVRFRSIFLRYCYWCIWNPFIYSLLDLCFSFRYSFLFREWYAQQLSLHFPYFDKWLNRYENLLFCFFFPMKRVKKYFLSIFIFYIWIRPLVYRMRFIITYSFSAKHTHIIRACSREYCRNKIKRQWNIYIVMRTNATEP